MIDLFDRIYKNKGPLGMWASQAEGYFVFPKLEGPISTGMIYAIYCNILRGRAAMLALTRN